jgi:hypothetical protein
MMVAKTKRVLARDFVLALVINITVRERLADFGGQIVFRHLRLHQKGLKQMVA